MSFRNQIPNIITPKSLPQLPVKQLAFGKLSEYHFLEKEESLLRITLQFECGKIHESKLGLNEACVQLLLSGNEKMSAHSIQEKLDQFGAFIELEGGLRSSYIQVFCLKEYAEKVLDILAEVLDTLSFVEDEIRIYKNRVQENLKVKEQKTSFLAKRAFKGHIFGTNTVYGSSILSTDIESINQSDLIEHFNTKFKHSLFRIFTNTYIPEHQLKSLEKFSRETIATPFTWNGIYPEQHEIHLPKADAVQATLISGFISAGRKEETYPARSFLSTVLGGYFGSRLMKNIREEKGFTYGIHSAYTNYPDLALFQISSDVKNEVRDEALAEIRKEIKRLQTELIDNSELETVRNYMLGSLQRAFDGSLNLMDRYKTLLDLGLPMNYFQEYVDSILELNANYLQEIASIEFDAKRFYTVVAGNFDTA
ncbi:MAG: insulinase family protein [Bacteroidetes bacterium]|nr:MAG: insulinase family protein [Bacteroidota bacterium]